MTLQQFKNLMHQYGFSPAHEWTQKEKYASYEKGGLAACYVVEGMASLWVKSGETLLPFTPDLKLLEQSLQQTN